MPSRPAVRGALFRDRPDAGRRLAKALLAYRGVDALVLALPRGGVPVAAEVARTLGAQLDVIVARKLGAPGHEEFGVGAIAPGVRVLDETSLRALALGEKDIAEIEARERQELERRTRMFRGDRPAPRVAGRVVILVDDGVATGVTARAALRSLRHQRPARLIFAAPVGPAEALRTLGVDADEVVLLEMPEPFYAVGAWYGDFSQTPDEEVMRHLREAPRDITIPTNGGTISGTLSVPPDPLGLVIFAHGSGSSRHSPRNQHVARVLQERGLATLLLDLLTPEEERTDLLTREHRFDLPLLASRLALAADWARGDPVVAPLRVGFFGSSTGGGAALIAAARLPGDVGAVVSRGGRPDLAGDALALVEAPTLLLVGERDEAVIKLNEDAVAKMRIPATLQIVPGATHLFEEPGTLDEVASLAADWFTRHLASKTAPAQPGKERSTRPAHR